MGPVDWPEFGQLNGERFQFEQFARFRVGQDFQIRWKNFLLEAEGIQVFYDLKVDDLSLNKQFFYGLIGYDVSERLFVYGAYYDLHEDSFGYDPANFGESVLPNFDLDVDVSLIGFSYSLSDRIRLEGTNIGREYRIKYT